MSAHGVGGVTWRWGVIIINGGGNHGTGGAVRRGGTKLMRWLRAPRRADAAAAPRARDAPRGVCGMRGGGCGCAP